jgi:hypothetical protein
MSERDEGEESRAVLTLQKIGLESGPCCAARWGWRGEVTDPREALCKRFPRFVLVVVFEPDVVSSCSDVFNVGARDDDDVFRKLASPFASSACESPLDQAPAGDADSAEQTGGGSPEGGSGAGGSAGEGREGGEEGGGG